MKKFNITVNGNSYEVEVEEIKDGVVSAPRPQVASAPAQAAPKAAPAPAKKAPAPSAGGDGVKAPMPGTILDIKVSEGQEVKSGQVLVILEAMKMENELVAPKDGVVQSINVSKGASVNSGDVLITIG